MESNRLEEILDGKSPELWLEAMVGDLFMDFLYYDRKDCEIISAYEFRELMDNGTLPKEMFKRVFLKQIDSEWS